jgi:hypothetical protein
MNERIKELLSQAAEYARENEPTDKLAAQLVHWEKFADLLLMECLTLTGPDVACLSGGWSKDFKDGHYIGVTKCNAKIRSHFGIGVQE